MDIKEKIKTSPLLSESEKNEWFSLMSRMAPEQLAELDKLLTIKMPAPANQVGPMAVPQEPKNQETKERFFPISSPPPSTSAGRHEGETREGVVENVQPRRAMTSPTLPHEEGDLIGFDSLTVDDLRQAESPEEFFETLKGKIGGHLEGIKAFQKSPLYQSYLKAGMEIMEGKGPTGLTKSEFEIVAEFRASLKNLGIT